MANNFAITKLYCGAEFTKARHDMLYRQRTIETAHGDIETPTLFPVRNIGTRSSDDTPEYTETIPDLSTAMVNARAIRQRTPLWDRLQDGATLREEMGATTDSVVFADSGGFGFQEDEVDTTPKQTLETQRLIGADIYGTVDCPLSKDNQDVENQNRIERSTEYALEASDLHEGDELLIASIHGYDPETIRNGIKYLEQRGEFDGYALGSLVPIRNDYKKVTKLILAARQATDKYLHVYGLGGIVYQPLLLYMGVDSFDSSSFVRSAGKRHYLVPGFGGEQIQNVAQLEHLPCSCPVCSTHTLSKIRKERELIARHNLWALTIELRRFRYVYEMGTDIEEYLDLRFQGNEVTQRAYRTAKQQVRRLT